MVFETSFLQEIIVLQDIQQETFVFIECNINIYNKLNQTVPTTTITTTAITYYLVSSMIYILMRLLLKTRYKDLIPAPRTHVTSHSSNL